LLFAALVERREHTKRGGDGEKKKKKGKREKEKGKRKGSLLREVQWVQLIRGRSKQRGKKKKGGGGGGKKTSLSVRIDSNYHWGKSVHPRRPLRGGEVVRKKEGEEKKKRSDRFRTTWITVIVPLL